jgi:hypothetical protein
MKCPDINQYLDALIEGESGPGLEAHLRGCPSCQEMYRLLTDLRAALRPEEDVPDFLIQRVLDDLPRYATAPAANRIPSGQILGSGVLGAVSVLAALVITGSASVTDPSVMLAYTVGIGALASVFLAKLGPRVFSDETARDEVGG